MAPTPTGPVATDASAVAAVAANPAAEPPRPVAVPPDAWLEDLAPISDADWNYARARHLLDRAGFGGTPDDIARLARMTPEAAVRSLVDYQSIDNGHLTPFEHSGVYDPDTQPVSADPARGDDARRQTGEAMGIMVKPSGTRKLQPVANRFFYWLRASMLETRRVANWWADRMVATDRPLEEKMALFWHGHFASGEDKVRDYRKMLGQVTLFQRYATGNFRELLIAVAQDPAMLVFLDAGQNVKGAPNENFGREVMELFTMGVGNYTEQDIREGARAFTGWRDDDLTFRIDPAKHDDGEKTFLGRTGRFDGVQILEIILEQKVTAELHRRQALPISWCARTCRRRSRSGLARCCATTTTRSRHSCAPIFLSRDFYSAPSVGTHIKGPVELIVSTYRRLGLKTLPGVPDFNAASGELGAGAAQSADRGRMGARARVDHARHLAGARQFRPRGRDAGHDRLRRSEPAPGRADPPDEHAHPQRDGHQRRQQRGEPPRPSEASMDKTMAGAKAMANLLSDHEEFNTHYASLKGWEEAVRKIKPILRAPAQFSLTEMVFAAQAKTTADAVDLLLASLSCRADRRRSARRDGRVPGRAARHQRPRACPQLSEEPLRLVAHLIMSAPEYQLA